MYLFVLFFDFNFTETMVRASMLLQFYLLLQIMWTDKKTEEQRLVLT